MTSSDTKVRDAELAALVEARLRDGDGLPQARQEGETGAAHEPVPTTIGDP
jgi:hypothetical protein